MIHLIQVLLCAMLAVQQSWADIPYKDVKLQVFDSQPRDFERALSDSLEATKIFWADESVQRVIKTGASIENFLPFGKALATIAGAITDLLKEGSEWKAVLAKELGTDEDKEIIFNQIEWFASKMNSMKQNLPLLDKENEAGSQTRLPYALSAYHDIYKMLDQYHSHLRVFRKYPMATAPLLINLALLITVFMPLINEMVPSAANKLPIACNALDAMKMYRSLTVYDRLQKVNLKYLRYMEVMTAMEAINTVGVKSHTLSCERGCREKTTYCQSNKGMK